MDLKKSKIIAATTSPRRKHLLKKLFKKVSFQAPKYKEHKFHYFPFPVFLCLVHACFKALNIKAKYQVVLGFDTMVFRGIKLYNKPKNEADAFRMIEDLSNKKHKVVTGIVLRYKNKVKFLYSVSVVKFRKLTRQQIKTYIKTQTWQGKAGGYGIQDKGKSLIEYYKGDYYNIVGLPLYLLESIKL